MRITATTTSAPSGVLYLSGNISANRTPVFVHTKCIGLVTIVIGTWKKMMRKVMASQNKNGFSHPVLELNGSCRPAVIYALALFRSDHSMLLD